MSSRKGLLFVLGGVAAGLGLSRVRKKALNNQSLSRKRLTPITKVGTKAGGAYAVNRARKVFAGAERREELDASFQLKTAEQVAETLGNMKGAMMKLGQLASYLDQGMPEPVREALAQLQQDAPSMSGELAAEVIQSCLGAPPLELFAEWDPKPIAAASIGQVHRAMTKDGRAVAVKVQYPGIADAITGDMGNADLIFQMMGMMFPGLDPKPLVEELRTRLIEEVDYDLEASNQKLFSNYYQGHPFIHVPEVVDELSGAQVLTTELADGVRFSELLSWSQDERDLAGETIYRFVFRSLYRLHAFNGDPHPGNYLFRPGGQVTFLDFGLVKRFDASEVTVFNDMVKHMVVEGDVKAFRELIESVGLLAKGQPFSDQLVEEYFGHFYEVVLEDKDFTLTQEYASESVRRIFDTSGPMGEIMKAANVPPSFVIIQRINLGLYAVLGELSATANWRRIAEELWPFINAPASSPLGEKEAAWAAAQPVVRPSPATSSAP